MKHKVLSVLFATVFTAGMLAGCGSSDTASQKQEMTLEEESTEGQTAVDDETAAKAVSEEEAEQAGFTDSLEDSGEEESGDSKTQLKMNLRKILLKIQNPWKRMQKTVRKRNLMMVQIKLPQQELQ